MSKKILLKKILLLTICSLILMSVNIKNIYGYGETNTTNLTSNVTIASNTSQYDANTTTNETSNTTNTNTTNTNTTNTNTTNTNTTAIVPTPPSSDVNSTTITPSIVHKLKRIRTIPTSIPTPVPSIESESNAQVTNTSSIDPNASTIVPAQTPNLTPTITSAYEQPIILILPAQNTTTPQNSNPGTGILGGDYFDKIFLALILGFIGLIYEVIRIKYEHKTKRESDDRTLDDFNIEKNKSPISEKPNIDSEKPNNGKLNIDSKKPNIDTKNLKR